MTVVNLTQHVASAAQVAAGVIELDDEHKTRIRELLTIDSLPQAGECEYRAEILAEIAAELCRKHGTPFVMIGGAPFLMPQLCRFLGEEGLTPVFAFSKRIVSENPETGEKIAKFVHKSLVDEFGNPVD